jgi:hypothetical protein
MKHAAPSVRHGVWRLLKHGVFVAPLLALPVSVLFAETWMRLEIVANDYKTFELRATIQQAERIREDLMDQKAELEATQRLYASAPDLGLVNPGPDQLHVVYAAVETEAPLEEGPFDVAALAGVAASIAVSQ